MLILVDFGNIATKFPKKFVFLFSNYLKTKLPYKYGMFRALPSSDLFLDLSQDTRSSIWIIMGAPTKRCHVYLAPKIPSLFLPISTSKMLKFSKKSQKKLKNK
jgi:hypothetical protein